MSNMSTSRKLRYKKLIATAKTYDEWKASGFQVMKGEKCFGVKGGKAVFSEKQVKPVAHKRWDSAAYYGDGDADYDEDWQIEDYIMDIGSR